ncbi:MAG TPA: acetyl-CoA carboxylase biotin carboxyl carrier protein [Chloroflexia bacterium]|nr:acetyl-CoA carboxylase biotin carboxyl carrier protein [Chloroflexia bacterium]
MVRLPEKGSDDSQGKDKDKGQEEAPSLTALSHEVKELVRLISSTDVSELHLESGQVRIIIKRGGHPVDGYTRPTPAYIPPATLPEPVSTSQVNLIGQNPAHGEEVSLGEGEELIVAPMVGTFYAASSPTQPPFVSEGDFIEPGQPVGIIEAMKMMNEIEAEFGGTITRILVQNAQPVEYGQPLMVVQTA